MDRSRSLDVQCSDVLRFVGRGDKLKAAARCLLLFYRPCTDHLSRCSKVRNRDLRDVAGKSTAKSAKNFCSPT